MADDEARLRTHSDMATDAEEPDRIGKDLDPQEDDGENEIG